MLEYITQTIFLFVVLFTYLLSGSVVYSLVGEGYKATPLRCFSVGVAFWVLIVILSTALFPVGISTLWWVYVFLVVFFLFTLPKNDQKETLNGVFFYQILTSVVILLPVFYFLKSDSLHLWQEFAVYAKGFYSLIGNNSIPDDILKFPLAYQIALVPVSFFTSVNDNIFACFNLAVLAFVACEFVRNSGVKVSVNNVAFPLVVTFTLLIFLNPFSINELILSADPFIFIGAVAFAFAEYIFRAGHLPRNIAVIPPALILMLLSFSSTQGLLLAFSLFVTVSIRYAIQSSVLNHKQFIGYILMPTLSIFMVVLWQFFLAEKGMDYLLFDISKLNADNLELIYNAIFVLMKKHTLEVVYIVSILCLGLYSFKNVKSSDDLIIDKYLIKSAFWVSIVYLFICLPLFFTQYDYMARASYSLGFSSIALLQFIILMPIGRFIKEGLDKLDIQIAPIVKFTIMVALVILFVMNRFALDRQQNYRIINISEISEYIEGEVPVDSKVAIFDIKKTVNFYKFVLDYKNTNDINYESVNFRSLPKGIKNTYESLQSKSVDYILLHAPSNLLIRSFEHNLDPKFSYLYKIEKDGFHLVKKFENKLYKDTNILIK